MTALRTCLPLHGPCSSSVCAGAVGEAAHARSGRVITAAKDATDAAGILTSMGRPDQGCHVPFLVLLPAACKLHMPLGACCWQQSVQRQAKRNRWFWSKLLQCCSHRSIVRACRQVHVVSLLLAIGCAKTARLPTAPVLRQTLPSMGLSQFCFQCYAMRCNNTWGCEHVALTQISQQCQAAGSHEPHLIPAGQSNMVVWLSCCDAPLNR